MSAVGRLARRAFDGGKVWPSGDQHLPASLQ